MAGTATRIQQTEQITTAAWFEPIASLPNKPPSVRPQEPKEWNSALKLDDVIGLYAEVFEAQQVQRKLSGARRLQRGRFEIAAEIFPVQHFSGDFVCIFDQGDCTVVAFGDVAGKGLTAAMWSTHVMSVIRTYSASLEEPSAMVSAITRDLCTVGSGVPITTMFLAKLDWRRNEGWRVC